MSWLAFNVRRSPYLSLGISSDAPRLYNVGFNGFNGDTDVGDARARARYTRLERARRSLGEQSGRVACSSTLRDCSEHDLRRNKAAISQMARGPMGRATWYRACLIAATVRAITLTAAGDESRVSRRSTRNGPFEATSARVYARSRS